VKSVAPPTPIYDQLDAALRAEQPVALATVIDGIDIGAKLLVGPGREAVGTLGDPELDRIVARDALGELETGVTGVRHYGAHGEQRDSAYTVFIESFAPPPQMVIFGAVDFSASLARVAKVVGYKVIVCDAREVFATTKRFPMADEVIVAWPDTVFDQIGDSLGPRDAACILTHDTKFDVPAVVRSLASGVGYIGIMGSRGTHAKRVERLLEIGVSESDLTRLMAPIGLDIGSRTPEETAVAICAEIIAVRSGTAAPSLRDADGPIHR
jgi:xanthine dehydrogenase accessory factor